MRLLIIFTLGLALMTGCQKGKAEVTLKGTIIDVTFGKPLTDANVSLHSQDAGSTQLNLIASSSTSETGAYSFTFPRNQVQSYFIIVEKNNYFPINEEIPFSEISIEENNVYHYATAAKSWVKLHFVNIAPSAPSDQLRFILQDGKTGCDGCASTTDQFIYGIVDTSIVYLNDGNTTFSFLYDIVGSSEFGVLSTNTTAFDTTEILLEY